MARRGNTRPDALWLTERLARRSEPTIGHNLNSFHLPTTTSYADIEEDERRRAVACVRRVAPADWIDMLNALGLTATPAPRHCPSCKKDKDVEQFARKTSGRGGRQHQCRDCVSEQRRVDNDQPKEVPA